MNGSKLFVVLSAQSLQQRRHLLRPLTLSRQGASFSDNLPLQALVFLVQRRRLPFGVCQLLPPLRPPLLQFSQRSAQFFQLLFLLPALQLGLPLPSAGLTLLRLKAFQGLGQAFQQHGALALFCPERQQMILNLAQLFAGLIPLLLRFIQPPARLNRLLFQVLELLFELFLLLPQPADFIGPREHSCVFIQAAACHSARGIDQLAVQGDDAIAVRKPPGQADGAVDILRHRRGAQQAFGQRIIFRLPPNQLVRHSHKARLAFQGA